MCKRLIVRKLMIATITLFNFSPIFMLLSSILDQTWEDINIGIVLKQCWSTLYPMLCQCIGETWRGWRKYFRSNKKIRSYVSSVRLDPTWQFPHHQGFSDSATFNGTGDREVFEEIRIFYFVIFLHHFPFAKAGIW